MKFFIASDIHGSEFYCKKMLDCYKTEKADKLLLLGDLLYHGPRNDLPRAYNPKAVIEMLNNLKNDILCVRGNCDSEVDQMVLEFPILADYCVLSYNETMIFATHGHKFNRDNIPPLKNGDFLLHGHTHIPVCEQYDNFTYINPGSVSIPKEDSHHGYIVFEDGIFIWKDLDGNLIKKFAI